MITLYSPLESGETHRLQHMAEVRFRLEKERDFKASMYKKYRCGANVADGIDTALSVTSVGLSASGVGLLSAIVAAPVAIGLQAGRLCVGCWGACGKLVGRWFQAKARKHDLVPVVIEGRMLQVQFDTGPGCIILSRGRRGGGSGLLAECNGVVIDARTWKHLAVPPRAFDPRPSKKEFDRAFAAPDADGDIRTGYYNVTQVIDGTVVTIHSWTQPKKGLVWCLVSANGYDVSNLKWGGDETYAEVLFELLDKSPSFSAATGLRLRCGLLCVDDVRLDFQTLDRGRYYTIGFRHSNFHPMAADPPGVWNIQSVDLASGIATAVGLPGIPRQAAYNRESLVGLVGSQDVRRRGIRVEGLELISRRALDDAKTAVPRLLASREWVFNTSLNNGFILRSRRPEVCPDVLYASPFLHCVRQVIYSRRSPQQVQSVRYQCNSLRAFLSPSDRSDSLELIPEFAPCFAMYEGFVNNVVDFVINPDEIKMIRGE